MEGVRVRVSVLETRDEDMYRSPTLATDKPLPGVPNAPVHTRVLGAVHRTVGRAAKGAAGAVSRLHRRERRISAASSSSENEIFTPTDGKQVEIRVQEPTVASESISSMHPTPGQFAEALCESPIDEKPCPLMRVDSYPRSKVLANRPGSMRPMSKSTMNSMSSQLLAKGVFDRRGSDERTGSLYSPIDLEAERQQTLLAQERPFVHGRDVELVHVRKRSGTMSTSGSEGATRLFDSDREGRAGGSGASSAPTSVSSQAVLLRKGRVVHIPIAQPRSSSRKSTAVPVSRDTQAILLGGRHLAHIPSVASSAGTESERGRSPQRAVYGDWHDPGFVVVKKKRKPRSSSARATKHMSMPETCEAVLRDLNLNATQAPSDNDDEEDAPVIPQPLPGMPAGPVLILPAPTTRESTARPRLSVTVDPSPRSPETPSTAKHEFQQAFESTWISLKRASALRALEGAREWAPTAPAFAGFSQRGRRNRAMSLRVPPGGDVAMDATFLNEMDGRPSFMQPQRAAPTPGGGGPLPPKPKGVEVLRSRTSRGRTSSMSAASLLQPIDERPVRI